MYILSIILTNSSLGYSSKHLSHILVSLLIVIKPISVGYYHAIDRCIWAKIGISHELGLGLGILVGGPKGDGY